MSREDYVKPGYSKRGIKLPSSINYPELDKLKKRSQYFITRRS